MNLIPVRIGQDGTVYNDRDMALFLPKYLVPTKLRGKKVIMGLRPEHVLLHQDGIIIDIEMIEILGSEQLIHGRAGEHTLVIRTSTETTKTNPLEVGESIQIGLNEEHTLHWFDADTTKRIEL